MGLLSWFNDRVNLGMIRKITKQKVHILWAHYKAVADQNLTEAEKWQRAVASRLTFKDNYAGLQIFEGEKTSITNFQKACSFVCEVEIFRNGLDKPNMEELLLIQETIVLEILAMGKNITYPKDCQLFD